MAGLRILMISHVPLVEELGAGRVQLELADELRRLGHEVNLFDVRDASMAGRITRRLRPGWFATQAGRYVKANGDRFDVIDAHHGCLPFTKAELRFTGALVARSSGLYAFYSEFEQHARRAWPKLIPGSFPARAVRRFAIARNDVQCRRSLETCDLALLLTPAEVAWAREQLGESRRWQEVPNGISHAHGEALLRAAGGPRERLAHKEVSFVGAWGLRKGSADWPEIIRRVRQVVPETSFSFLGTGVDPGLGEERVTVVPSFRLDELPTLLADATVGALPSYAEGWGLGLLEQLAAGLPCVAYDVSGPRTMLSQVSAEMLVEPGAQTAFADRLADLLLLDEERYAAVSARAVEVAAAYRWPWIARQTAELYAEALAASPTEPALAA